MGATLLKALGATSGLVCAAGAGGKKTALYALARSHPGRVAVTATVPITHFPSDLRADGVVAGESELEREVTRASARSRVTAYARPSDKPGRHGGVAPATAAALHRRCGFDLSLIKADGARMRSVKAPRDGEPNLPPAFDTLLFVVSIQVVGRPLDERRAHRVERLARVTGARPGEPLTALHLARLLASPAGGLKGAGRAGAVMPVINGVDDVRWANVAREVAERALALSARFNRVALTALKREPPWVECVYNDSI